MTDYTPQKNREHYARGSYREQFRWNAYWHQLDWVRATGAWEILEIGIGEGVVARELARGGSEVTTLDIADDLQPDAIGSVTAIPFPDDSFDLVLAAEILEHIRFEDLPTALREVARVSRRHAVISLPHPGYVFSLTFKLPLLPTVSGLRKIPFFWADHRFDGEHYWELGKPGYPLRRFLAVAHDAGLTLEKHQAYADDPGHRFFLFGA